MIHCAINGIRSHPCWSLWLDPGRWLVRATIVASLSAASLSVAGREAVDEPPPSIIFLRANQLGYRPDDAKKAVAFAGSSLPPKFEVVDANSGRMMFEGTVRSLEGGRWGRFDTHWELDFTPLTRPGLYKLRFHGTVSEPWRVGSDVFHGLPAQLLAFLRQQRCGQNPWLEVECHPQDGRTAFGPRAAGTALDARGGWHDAGDLLKYLLTSGNATAQMLLAWELHRPPPNAPTPDRRATLFPDLVDARGQPGTNGIPDLLDEARWGLEWMLKLHPTKDELYHQVADDRDHYGLRLPHLDQADYGWGPGQHRVVYCADGQPQGLGKFKSASTGVANLAGRYAAAMGLAWQIWNNDPAHAGFAQRCLQAGLEVYALGKQMEGVQQGNSFGAPYRYAEATWADDMEWGAVELFNATAQPHFLVEAALYARQAAATSWMGREETGHYEFYPFLNVGHYRLHAVAGDPELRQQLEAFYQEGLGRCAAAASTNPYGIGVPFIWCSNNLIVALVTQARLYEIMSGDPRYRNLIARHRDWLFGRNPWGVTMFTAVGWRYPTDVHLMTTRLTGRDVPGGLVDGPVYERIFNLLKGVTLSRPDTFAAFQDPRAVYHDDWYDYATNEPTMDGTASAILMLSALELP
jgi:endoglucanase